MVQDLLCSWTAAACGVPPPPPWLPLIFLSPGDIAAARTPDRMQLRYASPARLEFRKGGSWGAPVITGLLFGLFSLLPLLAPGPVTGARAAFALLLGLTALGLVLLARPRERNVRVALDAGVIEAADRSFPLARARAVALTSGGSTLEAAPFARYRAELVLDGGERLVVLESADPARVLRDLRSTLGYLPLPVTPGWGLGAGAEPWRKHPAPARGDLEAPYEERGRPGESELGAGLCVLGSAVVIGSVMALLHNARFQRGEASAWLSYLLSALLLGFIVLLGCFMVSDQVTARLHGTELVVERRALGIVWSRLCVPATRLGGVHAVGLVPGEPRHLLVEAGDELIAVAFVGEGAARLATRVAGWTAAATPPP